MGTHIHVTRSLADDDVRRVLDAFRRIIRSLRESSRHSEAHTGLSGAQLFVLRVAADGDSLSIGEVAAKTHTHQSSVSVVVQRLAERGLLRLTRPPRDARRHVISLTPRGRMLLRTAADPAQVRLVDAIAGLPPRRRRELALALRDVVVKMGLGEQTPEMFFEEAGTTRRGGRHV